MMFMAAGKFARYWAIAAAITHDPIAQLARLSCPIPNKKPADADLSAGSLIRLNPDPSQYQLNLSYS